MSDAKHDRDCTTEPCTDCRLAVPPTDIYRHARRTLRVVTTEGETDG